MYSDAGVLVMPPATIVTLPAGRLSAVATYCVNMLLTAGNVEAE